MLRNPGGARARPDPVAGLGLALTRLEAKTGIRVGDPGAAQLAKLDMPSLHPAQIRMLRESRRYNVGVCGRRFGKTFLAADLLIDGPRKKGAVHGFPVALYAPTYQTMLESWRKLVYLLKPITDIKSEQNKRIDLVTGGSVEFWSLDNPDAGRGRKYATVVVDEAAMIKRLEEAWEQNIQPLLLDYQGEAWIISTPKGDNYFKTLFDRGSITNPAREPDWQSWQIPTWENPHIKRDEVEKLRAGMPRLAFLQEIEAQFVSFAGTFIKAEHLRSGQPPDGMTLYQGVDLAISMKENADFTAIVTIGVGQDGRVWIVDAERRRVGFRDALAFIKEKASRWEPAAIGVEVVQYQAAVVEELLRSTSLPVLRITPDKDKLTRAQGLITRYENGLVWHAETLPADFTNEMLSFGPDCEHDDYVDAAVYAYMQTTDYKKSFFILPEAPTPVDRRREAMSAMLGLPTSVVAALTQEIETLTCNSCAEFDKTSGLCRARLFSTRADMAACDAFMSGGEQ